MTRYLPLTVFLSGCATGGLLTPTNPYSLIPTPGKFTHVAASAIAFSGSRVTPDVPPGPAPPVDTTHPRAQCPTGGWITHGDGHRTRCLDCDPPYGAAEMEDQATEPTSFRKPHTKTETTEASIQTDPEAFAEADPATAAYGADLPAAAAMGSGCQGVASAPVVRQYVTVAPAGAGCSGSSTYSMRGYSMNPAYSASGSYGCSSSSAYGMTTGESIARRFARRGPLRRLLFGD